MKKTIKIIILTTISLFVATLYAAKCRMIDTSYHPPCEVPNETRSCEETRETVCLVYDSYKRGRTSTTETLTRGAVNLRCRADKSPYVFCTDRSASDCYYRQNYLCNNVVSKTCEYWVSVDGTIKKTVPFEGGIKITSNIFEVEMVKSGGRLSEGTRTYVTSD